MIPHDSYQLFFLKKFCGGGVWSPGGGALPRVPPGAPAAGLRLPAAAPSLGVSASTLDDDDHTQSVAECGLSIVNLHCKCMCRSGLYLVCLIMFIMSRFRVKHA
jgi:hypothetical protein